MSHLILSSSEPGGYRRYVLPDYVSDDDARQIQAQVRHIFGVVSATLHRHGECLLQVSARDNGQAALDPKVELVIRRVLRSDDYTVVPR